MKPSICLTSALLFRTATGCKESGVNPAGTWELTTLNASNQPPTLLQLKLDGGKLAGTLSRHAGSKIERSPLEDAQLKGSEISFAVHVYALRIRE